MTEPTDATAGLARAWRTFNRDAPEAPAYAAMIDSLRGFLDRLAGARPDATTVAELDADIARWSERLAGCPIDEERQIFGRLDDVAGRGQVIVPAFVPEHLDGQSLSGTVTFGRATLGGNGAAHGGLVAAVFDEVLGRLSTVAGRPMARTAYLHVDYRSITPIGVPLRLDGRFVREEGRKRFVRGTLKQGETLCAEAEGLFVELKPGQP